MPKSTSSPSPASLSVKSPRGDLSTRAVLEAAGGPEALEEALELAEATPDGSRPIDMLLSYLRDPAILRPGQPNAPSLTELARKAGLSRLELFDLLGRRDVAMAVFASRRKHLARVLDDIGEDAQSQIVPCKTCGGAGVILPTADELRIAEAQAEHLRTLGIDIPDPHAAEPPPCTDCNGVGHLRKIGDADARKLFFKLHGFDKGGAGAGGQAVINVGVQVNNNDKPKTEPVTLKVQRILDGG